MDYIPDPQYIHTGECRICHALITTDKAFQEFHMKEAHGLIA